jgi:glycerol-3-phosphate dehydrogenase
MKRDTAELSRSTYDILVIGGGIYGAWTAWDAALRGLSVALVDKGDFGSRTSSNSLKVIHGGLRYLQHADFRRLRRSICERTVLMRVAPHLVHPLPFLMPTYGHFMKGKELMSFALMMSDIIGFDRNQLEDPEKHLPGGRVISKDECLRLFPGVKEEGLTGGAIWYDCQMYNSERMLLSILRSAEKAGAVLANYIEVTGFLREGNRVTGVRARDVLTEEDLDIHAKIVVNTSGPWVDYLLRLLNGNYKNPRIFLSKAMNLVVRRQLIPKYAVGVWSKFEFKDKDAILSKGSRLLFIVPWREFSLIGTTHTPYEGNPDNFRITEKDIEDFIKEVNEAYPIAALKREDVSFFHGGLLPMNGINTNTGYVSLVKQYQIYDHMKDYGIDGLVSVVGVKYTEARGVAEKVVDLVFEKIGKRPPRCLTTVTPVYGGQIERFNDFLAQETKKKPSGLSPEVIRHLVYNYGSEYTEVLKCINDNPEWGQTVNRTSQVIKAEVVHGIRDEMAKKLSDVVLRRTELGSAGNPGDKALETCATIMARELDWSKERVQKEIEEVKSIYSTEC